MKKRSKTNKIDYRNMGILLLIIVVFVLVLLLTGRIFGSKVDWASQHIVFPEYFRMFFYKTQKIIPTLSFNLGMGQNVFYFSYYGLLSPIILLSYLLPSVPMYIYMPVISIICLSSSVIIFYKWVKEKYDRNIALITSLLFLLNSTFFYHFHRHIMFVIYMPFLLLALKGVDSYFKNKRILTLVISSVCLILSSYYFGAYGVIVVGIYTIYLLLKEKKFEFKKLFKIIYFEIIAVLISSILLLPTLYALLNGRIPTLSSTIDFINLISPRYNFNYTFYFPYYTWGLSFIYVLAVIYGFISKKKDRLFISTIMSLIILFPIFSYILNGGMYVDGKCYLPFLPIALLHVCDYIKDVYKKRVNLKKHLKYIIIVAVFLLICAFPKKAMYLLIGDVVLSLVMLYKYKDLKNKSNVFIPAILVAFLSFVFSSFNDKYMDINTYMDINNKDYYELSESVKEDDLYRISIEDNKEYTMNRVYNINSLRTSVYSSLENIDYFYQVRDTFQNEILNRDNTVLSQSSNILFNIYSGTKYLITSLNPPIGYKKVVEGKKASLYKNVDVLPIMYINNKKMSKREFDSLTYPYNVDALLNYTIVDEGLEDSYRSHVEKIDLDFNIISSENVFYSKENNHILIEALKDASMNIKVNNDLTDKVLIIKFKMNKEKEGFACSSDITINGINNSLSCRTWKYNNLNYTFEYVLALNDNVLRIDLSPDEFDISDFEFYTIDYKDLKSIRKNIKEIDIEYSGEDIKGAVELDDNSYVKTTLPYEEEGYTILVDNHPVNILKVDNTYIGFKIPKGKHSIKVTYDPPYLKKGKIVSFIGLILFVLTLLYKRIKK